MLTGEISPLELMAMEAVSDSALLWLVVHQRLQGGERMIIHNHAVHKKGNLPSLFLLCRILNPRKQVKS